MGAIAVCRSFCWPSENAHTSIAVWPERSTPWSGWICPISESPCIRFRSWLRATTTPSASATTTTSGRPASEFWRWNQSATWLARSCARRRRPEGSSELKRSREASWAAWAAT
ncbi:MAG: hypothetical protein M5U28_06745 [Sandaracinaceae bacterium]|nr:hypothetical protein [Sandaracinaceae bacterium]